MKPIRWTWPRAIFAAAMIVAASNPTPALAWPEATVKIIVPFSPGGSIDAITRILAEKLGKKWGQGVIIENRAGAGGNIGAVVTAQSPPDGYTLLMAAQSLATNVTLTPVPNFDPATNLEPIIFVSYAQDVLMVGKESPFHSVQDIIDAARKRPGELTFGSVGIGSSGHLATVLFNDLAGIKARHVAYTNIGQLQTDVMGERVSYWISTLGGQIGLVKGGNVRALAVSGAERARETPDVPTLKELGIPLIEPATWFGLFAPKGVPKQVVAKVNADLNDILNAPDMREQLSGLGFLIVGGTPEALAKHLTEDTAKWAKLATGPAFAQQ